MSIDDAEVLSLPVQLKIGTATATVAGSMMIVCNDFPLVFHLGKFQMAIYDYTTTTPRLHSAILKGRPAGRCKSVSLVVRVEARVLGDVV